MASLREEIVQRIGDLFRRSEISPETPDTDSAIETRRKEHDVPGQDQDMHSWYSDETALETVRKKKYQEYERMDDEAVEISSALDIYADNATAGDRENDETIEIVSELDVVKDVLSEVKERIGLDYALWSIAREMVKYGDCFEEVVVHPDSEVHRLKHLTPRSMNVVEDKWGRPDPEHPFEQIDEVTQEPLASFETWQILHFKMTKDRDSTYGVDGSLLHSIRKVFKQLAMIEEALVIGRLTRAQQRFGFSIDVNGIEPGEPTLEYLKEVKKMMKKKRTIDPTTGQMNLQYNPMSVEEDIFLPSRSEGASDVKVLQGDSNIGKLEDVEYFSKKLFAGLKVPKAWMGFEGETRARAVITELDVQFAKTVRRIQLALISELRKLFDFVLVTRGISPSAVEYTVRLPILSAVDELREWELTKTKTAVATMYKNDLNVSTEWVYKHLLELSEDDIEEIKNAFADEDSLDYVKKPKPSPEDNGEEQTDTATVSLQTVVEPEDTTAVANTAQEDRLSPRELRIMRNRLREELDSLAVLTEWEYEHRTGEKLSSLK